MDYTTPHGKYILTTMGAQAELSSDLIGIHVKKSQKQCAETGMVVVIPRAHLELADED